MGKWKIEAPRRTHGGRLLAFGITYSLLLILFGLCTEARWRLGGAMAVLLLAGPVGYASWLFVLLALGYVALLPGCRSSGFQFGLPLA